MTKNNIYLTTALIVCFIGAVVMTIATVIAKNPFFLVGSALLLLALLTKEKHARDKRRFFVLGLTMLLVGVVAYFY